MSLNYSSATGFSDIWLRFTALPCSLLRSGIETGFSQLKAPLKGHPAWLDAQDANLSKSPGRSPLVRRPTALGFGISLLSRNLPTSYAVDSELQQGLIGQRTRFPHLLLPFCGGSHSHIASGKRHSGIRWPWLWRSGESMNVSPPWLPMLQHLATCHHQPLRLSPRVPIEPPSGCNASVESSFGTSLGVIWLCFTTRSCSVFFFQALQQTRIVHSQYSV